jgi:hypothetical protein
VSLRYFSNKLPKVNLRPNRRNFAQSGHPARRPFPPQKLIIETHFKRAAAQKKVDRPEDAYIGANLCKWAEMIPMYYGRRLVPCQIDTCLGVKVAS